MNRKMAQILQERQAQTTAYMPARLEGQHSPRRPVTAGANARPKVTCAMLNETERMLLRAPNRHKSMLSAGAHGPAPLSTTSAVGAPPHLLCSRSDRVRPSLTRPPADVPAGLIFPTESASPTTQQQKSQRARPCSAAAAPTSANGMSANSIRRGAMNRSPTRQAAWGAGAVPAAPKLSPRLTRHEAAYAAAAAEYGDSYGAPVGPPKPTRPSTAGPRHSSGTAGGAGGGLHAGHECASVASNGSGGAVPLRCVSAGKGRYAEPGGMPASAAHGGAERSAERACRSAGGGGGGGYTTTGSHGGSHSGSHGSTGPPGSTGHSSGGYHLGGGAGAHCGHHCGHASGAPYQASGGQRGGVDGHHGGAPPHHHPSSSSSASQQPPQPPPLAPPAAAAAAAAVAATSRVGARAAGTGR